MTDEHMELPINGILDLHMFKPAEVKDLVLTYLQECRKRKIYRVRIIHGKGIGALRRTVHAALESAPAVVSYRLDGERGNWGATLVELAAPNDA